MKKELIGCYSPQNDMTFVMEYIINDNNEVTSEELVGYYYGEPTDENNKEFSNRNYGMKYDKPIKLNI